MAEALPSEVAALQETLAGLPGVSEVTTAIESLQGIDAQLLGTFAYAHLPHAALRRTNGGLPDEALIYVTFALAPTDAGWRTLEFLAWWARDQARGGELLQLRPAASPPVAGSQVQLGHTLRFQLELFRLNSGPGLDAHLKALAALNEQLRTLVGLFSYMLRELGAEPIADEA